MSYIKLLIIAPFFLIGCWVGFIVVGLVAGYKAAQEPF